MENLSFEDAVSSLPSSPWPAHHQKRNEAQDHGIWARRSDSSSCSS